MQRGESAVSRQVLAKALAGSPIYVMPMPERRTWTFLGLASYEGVLRGAVRPGAIATFAQDDENPDPLVDRGAPPQVVRQFLVHQAVFRAERRCPAGTASWHSRSGKMGPSTGTPCRSRCCRPGARSKKLGKRGEPRPIAGGSDTPEVQRLRGQVGAPMSIRPRGRPLR